MIISHTILLFGISNPKQTEDRKGKGKISTWYPNTQAGPSSSPQGNPGPSSGPQGNPRPPSGPQGNKKPTPWYKPKLSTDPTPSKKGKERLLNYPPMTKPELTEEEEDLQILKDELDALHKDGQIALKALTLHKQLPPHQQSSNTYINQLIEKNYGIYFEREGYTAEALTTVLSCIQDERDNVLKQIHEYLNPPSCSNSSESGSSSPEAGPSNTQWGYGSSSPEAGPSSTESGSSSKILDELSKLKENQSKGENTKRKFSDFLEGLPSEMPGICDDLD